MIKKHAFIIGNGTSRKEFDLNSLQGGTVFGCNALYREYMPDYLVSIDDGIIQEIMKSEFPKDKFIVPPLEEQWEPAECNRNRPRSNAGMNAMHEAIKMGHKLLFCLGVDFLIWDEAQSVSNIYEGSANYGPELKANFNDNVGRIRYLQWFAKKHKDVAFYFVFQPTALLTSIPDCDNIGFITYENMKEYMRNPS